MSGILVAKKDRVGDGRIANPCAGFKTLKHGDVVPYDTFVRTDARPSSVKGAGMGLFAVESIRQYEWIGFYPGKVTKRVNKKLASHTMGSAVEGLFIIGDPAVQTGVHMVNEAGATPHDANVWYVKLGQTGYVLYFAGRDILANEELFTCYGRNYTRRPYAISRQGCADPRCGKLPKHRVQSDPVPEWRGMLVTRRPSHVPIDFLVRAGLQDHAQPRTDRDTLRKYEQLRERLEGLETWLDACIRPIPPCPKDMDIADLEDQEEYAKAVHLLTQRCKTVREEMWRQMPPPSPDPHLVVGASWIPNGGFGLFAAADIPIGMDICSYVGQEHTFRTSQRLKDKSYLNRVSDTLFVDPRPCPGVKARYINDCINPHGHNVVFISDPEQRRVQVKATRDIVRGEELFVSYGEVYWEQRDILPTSLSNSEIAMKRSKLRARTGTK